MIDETLLNGFIVQFDNLAVVVKESAARVIAENPDTLFYDNQNVFIKSYLVSACSILEAFIQDLAICCADMMQDKINAINLPFNFINWVAEHDKANLKFASFVGGRTSKDISDMISPNYHKTINTFRRIGVDVICEGVVSHKDFISSIVEKRNKIVHHNDAASDLSFPDIIIAIDNFKMYSTCLYTVVRGNPHLAA